MGTGTILLQDGALPTMVFDLAGPYGLDIHGTGEGVV